MEISQRAIAKKLGVSQATISRLFSGEHGLTWKTAKKIAEKANISFETLRTGTPKEIENEIRSSILFN